MVIEETVRADNESVPEPLLNQTQTPVQPVDDGDVSIDLEETNDANVKCSTQSTPLSTDDAIPKPGMSGKQISKVTKIISSKKKRAADLK